MKPFFKPIPLILLGLCIWITVVCASLLSWDDSGNLIAHSYSVWGDWSAHLTFMSAFQERGLSWLGKSNPVFQGMPFQYPFLSHLITVLLSKLSGLNLISASYISSLILIFTLPIILYRWFRQLKLSEFASMTCVLSFLLIGGFQWMDSGLSTTEPLTNQFQAGSVFTQFILFEFFPQRAFLFGITALILLFTALHRQKSWNYKKAIAFALGFSLLSLLHIHSWIAMGVLLLSYFVFPAQSNLKRKDSFILGLLCLVLSSVFLYFLILRDSGGDFKGSWDLWFPGWAQNEKSGLSEAHEMNPLKFWLYNTALFLPLSGVGIYLSRAKKEWRAFIFSGLLLFGVALTVNLQPYFYDNLKTLTYSFLFLVPFIGITLDAVKNSKFLPRYFGLILAILILGVQTTSAIRDLAAFEGGLQKTIFFTQQEMELADQFKSLRSSPESLVLIAPKHNHWLSCLSGNPVFMGYPGWLWSWGIQYTSREREVNEILEGGPSAEYLIQNHKIQYAVLSAQDRVKDHPININFFESHYKKVLDEKGWRIYSLDSTLKSPDSSVR
jgi:hypothetical protein